MEATKKSSVENQKDELGASMLEYSLIAVLIAVVCIASITFMGNQVSQKFSSVGSSFNNLN